MAEKKKYIVQNLSAPSKIRFKDGGKSVSIWNGDDVSDKLDLSDIKALIKKGYIKEGK